MFFEHNTAALLRMDLLKRYQAYQIGIASRILNPNECRARENLLPYEGGDEYANPNTTSGAAPPAEPADTQDKTEGDAMPEDKPAMASDTANIATTIIVPGEGRAATVPQDESEKRFNWQSKTVHLDTVNLRRVVVGITGHARKLAADPKKFIEWIDAGLQQHRREAVRLLGSDEIVEVILTDLKRIAETTTGENLAAAVHEAMLKHEGG